MSKKMFIIAVVSIIIFLLIVFFLLIFVSVYQSREKDKILKKSKEVVIAWGTYNYDMFPEAYLKNLQPLVAPAYYKNLSEDKESLEKRKFNIKKNQYSFEAIPQEVLEIKREGDKEYTVTIKTLMKTSSKDINKEDVKNVKVSLKKSKKEYLAYYIIAK